MRYLSWLLSCLVVVFALTEVSASNLHDDCIVKKQTKKTKKKRSREKDDPSPVTLKKAREHKALSSYSLCVTDNLLEKTNAGTLGYVPIDVLNVICKFLTVEDFARLRSCCHYTWRIQFDNLWPHFAKNGGVFHTTEQTDFESIVRAHFLIPPSIRHEEFTPTQNFFYQVMDLAGAIRMGSFEAVFYLRELLNFRGHHYMHAALIDILAELDQNWDINVKDIKAASDDKPAKHIMLALMMRNGEIAGDKKQIRAHLKKAIELGDRRALLEMGRIYEKRPGKKNSKRARRYYRRAAEQGISLGHVKIAYMYMRDKNYKLARQSFLEAAHMWDSRGFRGICEVLKAERKDWDEYQAVLEAYKKTGDAYAYAHASLNLEGREFVKEINKAWEMGLTGAKFARNNWRSSPNWHIGTRLRREIDSGYLNAVLGILYEDTDFIHEAIANFKFTGHDDFAQYLTTFKE